MTACGFTAVAACGGGCVCSRRDGHCRRRRAGIGVDRLSVDLVQEYLPAARDLLHGGSPYLPSGTLTTAAGEFPYLYPPLLALLLIPLTIVPTAALVLLRSFCVVALALVSLYLVGVRDWRCYLVSLAWHPSAAWTRSRSAASQASCWPS